LSYYRHRGLVNLFVCVCVCGFSFLYISKEFYVETICDGEPARTVKCPLQNVISTVWASYGRQHSDICVDDDQLINATCKSDYDFVLSMVQETCDDTNSCNLESNKEEYGDPPECQGVKKYLQMYYLCKSGKIIFMRHNVSVGRFGSNFPCFHPIPII